MKQIEKLALTIGDVCERLSISRSTLREMLRRGTIPPAPLIVGKNGQRWPVELIDALRLGTSPPHPRAGRPRSGEARG